MRGRVREERKRVREAVEAHLEGFGHAELTDSPIVELVIRRAHAAHALDLPVQFESHLASRCKDRWKQHSWADVQAVQALTCSEAQLLPLAKLLHRARLLQRSQELDS